MPDNVLDSCCQMEIPSDFLDVRSHPTPADLERNMGKELVDIYLKTCTPIERVLFGRDKPLKGPSKLWISPEDHLDGRKVRLTPMRTESVQALTHHGILEIGKQIEEKILVENKNAIAEAIADAEGLAKFEADQRVKFHVDIESKKLNEEWCKRMDELTLQHEAETNCLREIYEEGCELLSKFITDKCSRKFKELMAETLAEARVEMEKECCETVDRELAAQSVLFQEQLQNTLSNLEEGCKDRMEEMKSQCLVAMDLQSHLLICQKITEMMHMMTMEKKRCRTKLMDVKREHEGEKKSGSKVSTLDDQSKSIKQLLTEMLQQLDGVDVRTLAQDEMRIFHEIHRIHDDVMIEASQKVCDTDEVLIIHQPAVAKDKLMNDVASLDWIDRKNDVNFRENHASFPAASFSKHDAIDKNVQSSFASSFESSIFQRFAQSNSPSQSSSPEELASKIIKIVKETNDDKHLKENVASIISNVMSAERFPPVDLHAPVVTLIPMPKPDGVNVKDSFRTIEKRVSIQEEPYESHHILAVVDSLELVNDSVSRVISAETSLNKEQKYSNELSQSVVPSCLNVVASRSESSAPYAKMTDDDWATLKQIHKAKKEKKSSRELSVQFEENNLTQDSQSSSRKSSILKRSSSEVSTFSHNQPQNALQPIYDKCFEKISTKSIGSVLMMLCEDDRRD